VAFEKNKGKYRHPNSKQIAPEIEKGMIDRCYLFLGEEEGEKENFIEKISAVFFGNDEKVISRFHCEGGDILAAVSFALETSMFSARKFAVIYNVEALNSKKDFSLVADIVNELNDSTLVIFTSPENNAPKAFSGDIGESVRTVIFWRMFESEL
jgi:DNA polymerase III delta subunit